MIHIIIAVHNNNNNNGYFYVLFQQRAHSQYILNIDIALSYKNGVNIELGKTNRLKSLRMMEDHT